MNDYKELVFNLMFLAKYCHSEYNDLCVDDELKNAANAIEQLIKERDAAVADLKEISDCGYCKWFRDFGIKVGCVCQESCNNISGVNTMWEWRGVGGD